MYKAQYWTQGGTAVKKNHIESGTNAIMDVAEGILAGPQTAVVQSYTKNK